MKLERSDIKFPLWRKKVDVTLFKDPATQFPNWLCKVWEMNTTNICFKGHSANVMIGRKREISVSNVSACSSATIKPSYVLTAMESFIVFSLEANFLKRNNKID